MKSLRTFLEYYLDPSEWLGDILFGLVMVLTITAGARLTVAEGTEATQEMLYGAIGCNVAWGLINGVMYILDHMFERGKTARMIRAVHDATDDETALGHIEDELDDTLETMATIEARTNLYRDALVRLKATAPPRMWINRDDLVGAAITCFIVSVTAFPAILPFLFMTDLRMALRVSNLLSLTLVFVMGFSWGRETSVNPWVSGVSMLAVGGVLVGIAEYLGG